jgi:adenine deaminase
LNNKKTLVEAAMGREKTDIILKGGNIVDVFTGSIFKADVAIKNGYICGVGDYDGENSVDVSGKYIMPGFIDAHMHIESSMVTPQIYAGVTLPHGVTTVIADPHEITNVCGEKGLEFMKNCAKNVPMDINYMLPSCVPATPFEHSGTVLTAKDTVRLSPEFFGIGEMMNYPGVCGGDDETLNKLCAEKIDGHAPLLSGHELDAYVSAGIKTDHECSKTDEMMEKISKGMYILLREGTLSKDIEKLYSKITPYTLRRCLFCTDDRFIGEIKRDGSIDFCIKKSIKLGVSPIDAIIMATLNAAECYGMKDKGAVAPSYRADLVISDSLELNKIFAVYKDGILTAKDGQPLFEASAADSSAVVNTVHLNKVSAADFNCDIKKSINAIELIPDTIITKKVTASSDDSLSKVCVLERHNMLGTKGIGFITNYGIKNAAIASSIGHDSHNVIVIGDNDSDMALAVNTLGKSGGISVCSNGKVLSFLPLEYAGLMSDKSADEVIKKHDELYEAAKSVGVTKGIDPFLSLAFLPLPVIPEIRITDSGLFDVLKFEFTDL